VKALMPRNIAANEREAGCLYESGYKTIIKNVEQEIRKTQ